MDKLPMSELMSRIDMAGQQLPIGSRWVHYKGGRYVIADLVILEASNEVGVVYRSEDHPGVKFLRALSVWQEMIEWEGIQVFRFRPDRNEPRAFDGPQAHD
jgi:hypothetical protein